MSTPSHTTHAQPELLTRKAALAWKVARGFLLLEIFSLAGLAWYSYRFGQVRCWLWLVLYLLAIGLTFVWILLEKRAHRLDEKNDALQNRNDPENIPTERKKDLISHFSKEIQKESDYIMNFRVRLGFTMLIGPFFVVGAILLSAKVSLQIHSPDQCGYVAAAIALLSYVLMGIYAASLDNYSVRQSNLWRIAIFKVSRGECLRPGDFLYVQRSYTSYVLAFTLLIIAFISMMVLAGRLFTMLPDSRSVMPAVQETQQPHSH